MDRLVSFILCTSNAQSTIKETIDSLLNQTFEDFEILIVLNGVSDNTANIIYEYDDCRIRIFESNIVQLNYNLNLALSKANGKYVARIDSDDICMPERLEKQVGFLEANPSIDVLGSFVEIIDEYGETKGVLEYPVNHRDIANKLLKSNPICHPSVMMKRDIILNNNGYLGGMYAQDYDLWIRLISSGACFHNLDVPLLKYRVHSAQSKGNSLSYSCVSSYFFREFVHKGNLRFLMSSLYFLSKRIFLSKNKI
ncbi:TPA: glycosyltransferase [Vibrio vulnificus]|uniref:glycosyltransferase n=1 Tax=Vibrio diabolicus TaxID=50719 RepID=UPI00215F541A|nr:glycosyltransferase [Vibrio diabolicus]MCS0448941.1 glycosyltransferase [Vibrio diabolicus]